ncbi:hypothetical protein [Spirosoma sp.]|uniref:hypothetical protein n=1 Tax=Spirosoma sp. TaxID=1899569 RepID=UPI003B3A9663
MKLLGSIGFVGLLLGNVLTAQAQSAPSLPLSSALEDEKVRRTVVKFAPLSLIDPDNTVQFGIERLFGQHHGVHLEFGYGWEGMNLWRNSQSTRYTDREVWRGRVEWRYYLNKTNQPRGRYIAVEGLYKQIDAQETGTVGVGCTSGPCQYYQFISAPIHKYVWGGHIKFGRQFALAPDSRWLADVYLGLGVRWRNIDRLQSPDGSYFYGYARGWFDTFGPTPYAILSVSYGAKIGYSF